jgi:hypothetical protein
MGVHKDRARGGPCRLRASDADRVHVPGRAPGDLRREVRHKHKVQHALAPRAGDAPAMQPLAPRQKAADRARGPERVRAAGASYSVLHFFVCGRSPDSYFPIPQAFSATGHVCVACDPFGPIRSFCGRVFCMSAAHVVRTLDPQPHSGPSGPATRRTDSSKRQKSPPRTWTTHRTVAARNAS